MAESRRKLENFGLLAAGYPQLLSALRLFGCPIEDRAASGASHRETLECLGRIGWPRVEAHDTGREAERSCCMILARNLDPGAFRHCGPIGLRTDMAARKIPFNRQTLNPIRVMP